MDGRFPFQLLPTYPHLKPRDIIIWERFLRANPDAYKTCDYDFPVGTPADVDEDLMPETIADMKHLTKLKIDVVAHAEKIIHIIEVKPHAGGSALGQVIEYDYLYTRDAKPEKDTQAVIITDKAQRDMAEVCAEHDIILIEVGF